MTESRDYIKRVCTTDGDYLDVWIVDAPGARPEVFFRREDAERFVAFLEASSAAGECN